MPLPNPCSLLFGPLRWLPPRLHAHSLALLLNRVLAVPLKDGELDFMRGKRVALLVTDLGVGYRLQLGDNGFAALPDGLEDDLRVIGELQTFLLLATQREDADSLFFQRRLRIEGDTVTGLHLKNFIDALGEPPLPAVVHRLLNGLTDLYPRYCRSGTTSVQPDQLNPARPFQ